MPFFTLRSLPSSCQTVLKQPWVVACNRAQAVYNVLHVMRCSLFNYSAGSLIYSIVCESTHPDCFSDVAATHKHTSTHTHKQIHAHIKKLRQRTGSITNEDTIKSVLTGTRTHTWLHRCSRQWLHTRTHMWNPRDCAKWPHRSISQQLKMGCAGQSR